MSWPQIPDPNHPDGPWGPNLGQIHEAIQAGQQRVPLPPQLPPSQWELDYHAERRQALRAWEAQAAAALATVKDRVERLVRAAQLGIGDQAGVLTDREIADWFLAHVQAQPTFSGFRVREHTFMSRVLGSEWMKYRQYAGWGFESRRLNPYTKEGPPPPLRMAVLKDGRLWYDETFTPHEDDGFSQKALWQMADLTELPALDLLPRPNL